MLSICILYSSMKQICDPNMWRKELYSTKVLRGETLKLCCRTVTWWPRTVPWWRGDIVTWWHWDIVTWWLSDMLTWWDGDIVIWRHCEMVTLWHGDPEVWRKEMPSSRWSAGEVSRAFPKKSHHLCCSSCQLCIWGVKLKSRSFKIRTISKLNFSSCQH